MIARCKFKCEEKTEQNTTSSKNDDLENINIDGLKILYIKEAYFKLPDGFTGDKEDALALFAEYSIEHRDDGVFYDAKETEPYAAFAALWPFDERRASVQMAVEEIIDGEWVAQKA